MWLVVSLAAVGLWFFVWSKKKRVAQLARNSILRHIACEYIKQRSSGGTTDQVKDSLYQHFSVTESLGFNPIPFENLLLASYARKLPGDALELGEIAYTILCYRRMYPRPKGEGLIQTPRDAANQYDAVARIFGELKVSMVVSQASGENPEPSIWSMLKECSAIENEISKTNALWHDAISQSATDSRVDD